jgi:LmbE family N-acetylglucosaminyl deacetylase
MSHQSPPRSHGITSVPVGNVATPICRPLPSRLLGVWAHPDDECYLSAGLMGRVVGSGGSVRVVCATSGERGTDDPTLLGTGRFARLRRAELAASLAELGVDDVRILGLGDGQCTEVDPGRMVDELTGEIRSFGPDAIVTFGPDGITGHLDHLAVSRWATAARAQTGSAGLLYAVVTRDHAARHRDLEERLGLYAELDGGRPASVLWSRVALQVPLERDELARKRRALAGHGSQTDALAALVGEETYLTWWRDESFRWPTPAERGAALANLARNGRPEPIGVGS